MIGIGSFINYIGGMNLPKKQLNLATTDLTIFWITKSKITNKHNNLLDIALCDLTSNFVSYSQVCFNNHLTSLNLKRITCKWIIFHYCIQNQDVSSQNEFDSYSLKCIASFMAYSFCQAQLVHYKCYQHWQSLMLNSATRLFIV